MQYDISVITSMNRIAFLSDIHGNLSALNAVLEDISSNNISKIYCLGDLVGYYSEINEVIDAIRSRGIECCMGNHDNALVFNNGIIPRSKTCTNILMKQRDYITKENLSFLAKLPNSIVIRNDHDSILCVHGGIKDPIDEYIDLNCSSYFDTLKYKYTVLITGHNHIATIKEFGSLLYGNTGSVGQPRDHDVRASYLIYDNGHLDIRRVEYCIDDTRRRMRERGFPDYISDVLYLGCRIGETINKKNYDTL